MAVMPAKTTRVSEYFQLGRTQPYLDFVDVPIGQDLAVFIDPGRLRGMTSTWAVECVALLQSYFGALLKHLSDGDKPRGVALLAALAERNEFHLGLSKDGSHGNAFGPGFAEVIWRGLTSSKASKSGLLQDLEDTCLFIPGIGPDRISDAVSNIIRGPLIKYTQDMCVYYGIPLQKGIVSGPIWDPQDHKWNEGLIPLPMTPYGKLLLVPKLTVRQRIWCDPMNYYTHYLLPEMRSAELQMNSTLIETLKSGHRRVTAKSLKEKYGTNKLAIVDQTLRLPSALEKYRQESESRVSAPLSHEQLAEIEQVAKPDLKALHTAMAAIAPGKEGASAYENAVEKLLSALLYPALSSPTKQHEIHGGRKRIDITYVNNARLGFFSWLAQHYSCAHVFVECKNYGKEVGNPEIDQLAGRFSRTRGQVGILVCRSIEKPDVLNARCKDTASDQRGYILTLTDEELMQMVDAYLASDGGQDYPLLLEKVQSLVM